MTRISNQEEFFRLCGKIMEKEHRFKSVIDEFGYPPFWRREPDFATLVLTILEQQVSLAAAKAAFDKLTEKIQNITPENFLKLTDDELRACYFSRQKILYTKLLATEIAENRLNLTKLNRMSEKEIRSRLIKLKGIGHWTIDMYVLMSLHFADIFPAGDLATIKSVYELQLVPAESSVAEIVEFMRKFSPYRSVATYILWHNYIERRNLVLE